MGAYASPFPLFFFGLIVVVLLTLAIIASRKKTRAHRTYEQNLTKLPAQVRARFESCKESDKKWFVEFGDALDGLELQSPLAVAIESGWRDMDRAEELLQSTEFSPYEKHSLQFLELLESAESHFATAANEFAGLLDGEVEQ